MFYSIRMKNVSAQAVRTKKNFGMTEDIEQRSDVINPHADDGKGKRMSGIDIQPFISGTNIKTGGLAAKQEADNTTVIIWPMRCMFTISH